MVFSIETVLVLVTAFSIVTSLAAQYAKMVLDIMKVRYASNVVVMVVAAVVGAGGTLLYYEDHQIPLNTLTGMYLAVMCILNCMGAMLGYDKVKQMLEQLKAVRRK